MGRKLIRDFVPGMRLSGEAPINGKIWTATTPEAHTLLGAEKIVEEAKELLEAVKACQASRNLQTQSEGSKAVRREVGDVYAALMYTAAHIGVDAVLAANDKERTHGGFTKSFVWEWEGDEQPPPAPIPEDA